MFRSWSASMPSWGFGPAQVRPCSGGRGSLRWDSPSVTSSRPPFTHRYPSDRLLRLLLHEQHNRRGAGGSGLWQSHHGGVQARRQAQRRDGGSHAGGLVILSVLRIDPPAVSNKTLMVCVRLTPCPPCSVPSSTLAAAARGDSACTTCRSTAAHSWPTSTVTVRPTPLSTSSPNTVSGSLVSPGAAIFQRH